MAAPDQQPTILPDVKFEIFSQLDMRIALVKSAELAAGTRFPSRQLILDLGPSGMRTSIGQFALVPESELVGRKVVACCNLGVRRMGKYESQALVMGTLHPASPEGQAQAVPLYAHADAVVGDRVF